MIGRIAASLLMLAVGLLIPAPALAVGSFDPPVTVIEPGCANATVTADAVGASDGKVYGFANFSGAGCSPDIWYFEGVGDSWTSQVSPYRGRVLGVARDDSATYLLYTDGRNTRITKRVGGVFTSGRIVGQHSPGGGGDVIAADGRWWATWFEGEIVYQAKTLGQAMLRRRVADLTDSVGGNVQTERLSLAARPGGGAVLIAQCCEAYEKELQLSAVRVFVSADGDWVRRFDIGGYGGYSDPNAATGGRVTWLAWVLDGQVQVTHNRTGRFVQRNFAVRGAEPRLAASDGKAFLAWTTRENPTRVFLAEETPDGIWTGTVVSPVTTRHQRLAAVAATGGKATVLMMTATRLYARSQP